MTARPSKSLHSLSQVLAPKRAPTSLETCMMIEIILSSHLHVSLISICLSAAFRQDLRSLLIADVGKTLCLKVS